MSNNLNSKERVRKSVNWEKVDRMPTGLFGTPLEYEEGLAAFIGADTVEEMYRRLGVDVWHCRGGVSSKRGCGQHMGAGRGRSASVRRCQFGARG